MLLSWCEAHLNVEARLGAAACCRLNDMQSLVYLRHFLNLLDRPQAALLHIEYTRAAASEATEGHEYVITLQERLLDEANRFRDEDD